MGIEINGLVNRGPHGANSNKTEKESQGSAASSSEGQSSAPASDSVSLTDTASRMSNIQQALADVPVVNADKVAELREAISNGSYQIDPEKVAEKLLSFEQNLG